MKIIYNIKKFVNDLFFGLEGLANATDPLIELQSCLGTPVFTIQELTLNRRVFNIFYNKDFDFFISLTMQNERVFMLDAYDYLKLYSQEMDYLQALELLNQLEKTLLTPKNIYSVITQEKQGYSLFLSLGSILSVKLPTKEEYESVAKKFFQNSKLKEREFINLLKKDYEFINPSPEEKKTFLINSFPQTATKLIKTDNFLQDSISYFNSINTNFYPFYLSSPLPMITGLLSTNESNVIVNLFLNQVSKKEFFIYSTAILLYKFQIAGDYLKESSNFDFLVSEEQKTDIEAIQEKMNEISQEIAGYILARGQELALIRVFIEPVVVDKNLIEHYLYVVASPLALKDNYYVFDYANFIDIINGIIKAKLIKLEKEGKIMVKEDITQEFIQKSVNEPVLFIKKIGTILNAYPLPR
jgi:hypothetical protein